MKKLFSIAMIAVATTLFSCETNSYQDWKIMNDAYFAAKDTVHYTYPDTGKDTVFYLNTAPSGLKYYVISGGSNASESMPSDYSAVFVRYTARMCDNTVFENVDSVWRSVTAFSGWQEGIKMLKDNGHILLVVPYQLGFGEESGVTEGSSSIPPYTTLYYDIKMYKFANDIKDIYTPY